MKPELSDMLRDAKADAPTPRYGVDDFVAAGRKQQRRRTAAWTGTAAAALAVVGAVAAPQILRDDANTGTTVAPAAAPSAKTEEAAAYTWPEGDFVTNIKGFEVDGLTVEGTTVVNNGYQAAAITAEGRDSKLEAEDGKTYNLPSNVGELIVYRPGSFDATAAAKGEKVDVDGATGYYKAGEFDYDAGKGRGKVYSQAVLTWEYADNSWAQVELVHDLATSADPLVAVAEHLAPATPETVKVGFELGAVPDGYRVAMAGRAGLDDGAPLEGQSSVTLVDDDFTFTKQTGPVNSGNAFVTGPTTQLGILTLTVYPAWYAKHVPAAGKVTCTEGICNRTLDGGGYVAELISGKGLPDAQLTELLNGVTFADPTDASTWKPVA